MLDLANAFLQLANTPVGNFITQMILLTGVFWGGTGLIKAMQLIPNLVNTAAISFSVFGTAISFGAPQLAIIAAGIAAIITVAPTLSDWWLTLTGDVEHLTEKIEEANNVLVSNKEQLQSLEETPWYDRTPEIEEEIKKLEEENNVLQENIDKWRNRIYGASVNKEEEGSQYLITQKGAIRGKGSTQQEAVFDAIRNINEQGANYYGEATLEALENLGYTLEMTEAKFAEMSEIIVNEVADSINQFASGAEFTEEALNKLGIKINENILALEAEALAVKELAETGVPLTESQEKIVASYDKLTTIKTKLVGLVEEQSALNETTSLTVDQYYNLIQQYPELNLMISQTTNGFELETQALVDALVAGEDWAISLVKNQKDATNAAIEGVTKRIEYFRAEMEILKAVAGIGTSLASAEDVAKYNAYFEAYTIASGTLNKLNQYRAGFYKETPMSGTSTGSGTTKDPIEEQNKLFQEQLEILEDRLFFMQKSGASEEEQIAQLQKMQEEVHNQADWFRSQGLAEDSEYLRESGKKWIEYYEQIQEISEESAEKARQAWEDSINEQIDSLQDLADKYKTAFSYVANKVQEEIDVLEDQKEAIQQRYDDEIDALQSQNEELERQIELEEALDSLSRARQSKVMVYKDGRFQYVNDIDQVSEAQSNLDKLNREEALRQEIENLEESRDAEIANIDTKIEYWQKMQEEWSNAVDQYIDEQNRLIAEEILGIELEGDNWETRLKNLQEYVDEYNSILSQIQSAEESLSSGGGKESSSISSNISGGAIYPVAPGDSGGVTNSDGSWSPFPGGPIYRGGKAAGAFADGTLSAPGGLSLVGENGPELRVLGQGDGVIPSDITKNLWAWGTTTPSSMLSTFSGLSSIGHTMAVTIQNLNLPGVHDGQGFVDYMRNNFWRKTLQFQTS